MRELLKKNRWSPYVVGALIGGLLATLFVLGQRFGTSTGIAKVPAIIEMASFPNHVKTTPHFMEILSNGYFFDWTLVFVIGIFLGSWLSSKLAINKIEKRDTIWVRNFGNSKLKRAVVAFLGGILLMFGARIADGCTSGHVITGGAQLSLVSFIFMIAMFATAVPLSLILYKK